MKHTRTQCLLSIFAALLMLPQTVDSRVQTPSPSAAFYDVAITGDEIYSYSGLKWKGDFCSIESAEGRLALGRTTAGVTVVILLSPGAIHLEAPEGAQEKFKEVFGGHPLDAQFNTLFMRLHPKDFDATIGKLELTRVSDAEALQRASGVFDERFPMSYHAGPKAILPPQRTRVLDVDLAEIGLVCVEEGYWLRVNRMSPFGKVYPRDFVNPKK